MLSCISAKIRKMAAQVGGDGYGESVYLNIPTYQQQTEPEEDSREIGNGPPSMYDEPDKSTRDKNKEDIRRQGPRPGPIDSLIKDFAVTETVVGEPRESLQGGPWNDTTTPDGRNEDRDTIGFDPDEYSSEFPFTR